MYVLSQDKQIWWQPCRPLVPDNEHLARLYPTNNREKIKTIHIFFFLCTLQSRFKVFTSHYSVSLLYHKHARNFTNKQ